jgi:hypothetical protein
MAAWDGSMTIIAIVWMEVMNRKRLRVRID